jgi:hypothetical protein
MLEAMTDDDRAANVATKRALSLLRACAMCRFLPGGPAASALSAAPDCSGQRRFGKAGRCEKPREISASPNSGGQLGTFAAVSSEDTPSANTLLSGPIHEAS